MAEQESQTRRPDRSQPGTSTPPGIAATINGAAIITKAAARAFDLRFLALEDHTVEIWIAQRWLNHPGAQSLADLLTSPAFTDRVAHVAGYDLTGCGTRI